MQITVLDTVLCKILLDQMEASLITILHHFADKFKIPQEEAWLEIYRGYRVIQFLRVLLLLKWGGCFGDEEALEYAARKGGKAI